MCSRKMLESARHHRLRTPDDVVQAMAVLDATTSDPFITRVGSLLRDWVQSEWRTLEELRRDMKREGETPKLKAAYEAAQLNVDNLARRLENMSVRTLNRRLHSLQAPPAGSLIRAARLRQAAQLLLCSGYPINEIAKRCGYESKKHFSVQFKKTFGRSPLTFRSRGQPARLRPSPPKSERLTYPNGVLPPSPDSNRGD